jgi:hypothetical protein
MARMMKDSEEKGESCSCGSSSCKKCGGTVKSKYAEGGMLASKGPKMRGQGSASAMTHKMIARNAAAKPARDAAQKARMDARQATAAAARTASDATKAAARKARYTTMKEAYKAKQEATKPQRDAARKVKMDELRAKRAADPTFSLNRKTGPTDPAVSARMKANSEAASKARSDARKTAAAALQTTKAAARKVRNESRMTAYKAEKEAPKAPMSKPAFMHGGKVKGMSRSKSRTY